MTDVLLPLCSDSGLQKCHYCCKVAVFCQEVKHPVREVIGFCSQFFTRLLPFALVQPRLCVRAQSYAERLRLGLAVLHGEANTFDGDMVDGPQSPPLQRPTATHTGLELPCKKPTSPSSLVLYK